MGSDPRTGGTTGSGQVAGSVGALGEFGLIAAVTARLGTTDRVLVGPGDDGAVLAAPDGRVVVSTDLLVEGRHFRRDWSAAADVGHKAAAQNLADIAAMGAVPTALVVGLGIPADLPAGWVEQLTDGLQAECDLVGAAVAGGDVVRAEQVTVAVTALGDLAGRAPVLRSGARPGDLVAVAGRLGWAAAGLAVLSRGFRSPARLVGAHRRPQPPYAEGPGAAALGATAMLDTSDGLVADLGHVAIASGVRIDLDRAALAPDEPLVQVAAALGVDPYDWVLGGGEDHALAATFPAGSALSDPWRVIGTVAAGTPEVLVDGQPPAVGGHDHFG